MTATQTTYATFTKLRDNSWGVRVNLNEGPKVGPGDLVTVQKRDGSEKTVMVAAVVYYFHGYRGNDRGYQLCTTQPVGDNTHQLIAPDMPANDEPAPGAPPAHHCESGDTVPVIPTNRFGYHAPTRCFTAEISDLGDLIPGPVARLFLESHVTGNDVLFTHHRTDKDRDGDVLAWEYLSSGSTGMKLTIYND